MAVEIRVRLVCSRPGPCQSAPQVLVSMLAASETGSDILEPRSPINSTSAHPTSGCRALYPYRNG